MNSRSRILAALNGGEMDRIPVTEIGVWPETRLRWIGEGMPADVSVEDYFGLDKIEVFPFDASVFTDTMICDIDAWVKVRDGLTPDLSRFEKYDRHFGFGYALPHTMKEQYENAKYANIFTVYSPIEPCWFYLGLLSKEEALCNIATNPDFVEQVISDYTDFNLNMMDVVFSAGYRFDALWVFSDLCYKNGMLFSPVFFRERVLPYQHKFFCKAKELNMKVIYHCDGYINEFVPLLIEAGVDCIQPLEVRAGNDMRDYMRRYPGKLSYMGNINADALAAGKESIYNEIKDKVAEAKKTRRYIYHSDHSIPDTVALEDFKYSINLAYEFGRY